VGPATSSILAIGGDVGQYRKQNPVERHEAHDCAYSIAGANDYHSRADIGSFGSYLEGHMGRRFGSTDPELVEIVQSAARLALECIGNSDAMYHNVEHTMLVTMVGYDILKGRRLLKETTATDFAHVIVACLFHDIGYVRGILKGDSADGYIIDTKGNKAELPRGSSDAALIPFTLTDQSCL
jgi:hypothetical protein